MNAPPAAATMDAASLARAVASALSLGLPAPDYITLTPRHAGSAYSAADFQFNDRNGQDPLPAMHAWAGRLGVTVRAEAGSGDPPSAWHTFDFEHSGVRFHAYAEIVAPDDGPCMKAGCGHEAEDHALALDTGDRLHCHACHCNRYLSPRPGGFAPEPATEPGLTFYPPPPLSRDLSGDLMAAPLPVPDLPRRAPGASITDSGELPRIPRSFIPLDGPLPGREAWRAITGEEPS